MYSILTNPYNENYTVFLILKAEIPSIFTLSLLVKWNNMFGPNILEPFAVVTP